jgi:outer membrane protein TolC
MKKSISKIVVVFFFGFFAQGQEILTLENAIKTALENNYEIKIAQNNTKVGTTNNSFANAGMLPSINVNLTNNNSQLNTKQTQADGTIRQLDGAKNMNLNFGVGLDWTVFDGLSMFARKEQLNVLEAQGKTALQATILSKISEVYLKYFDLVQQQQNLASIDTAIVISTQRVTTAQNRFSIGKASKLEVLNAQVDLNSDLSLQLKQKEFYRIAKIRMNELLIRDLKTDFQVVNEIVLDQNLDFNALKLAAESQNPTLQNQIVSKKIAEINLKQVKANRYPTVRLTSGYNFTESEASLGFITQSSGKGFVYGVTATVPVFNGFLQHKNEKVANYQVENANWLLQQQKFALETQLNTLFTSYQTNNELVKIEAKNVEIAKQNLDITLAKFKIGTITTIEFRTAQQNFVEANLRFATAQYQTKIAEINLKELAGVLQLK